MSVYIIAEAGVNHNGSKDEAFQLIDVAVAAGANAVKFQTFKTENLVTRSVEKVSYQKQTTNINETHFEMLKRLELAYEDYFELSNYCKNRNIDFLSTAFDLESLDFLVKEINVKTLKIPSGEITNGPLLLAHAQTGCDIILSTGMATLGEVENALSVLAFGLLNGTNSSNKPTKKLFQKAYLSAKGYQILRKKVTILHCTSEYPSNLNEININAMQTMRNAFGLKTGYSDHSDGLIVPIVAAALGAELLEKHFTLDKAAQGPDHKASLEPSELKDMVLSVRSVQQIMGDGRKVPSLSELKNLPLIRKSLVASTEIKKGECFSEKNLEVKRSGSGISPMEFWDILGRPSPKNFIKDELII